MTTTKRERRKLTNASGFTFPITVAPAVLDLVAAGRPGGRPYKYAVVRADGTLWEKTERGRPDVGLYLQRAAAVRHAKRTTGLIFDAAQGRVEVVGQREVGRIG